MGSDGFSSRHQLEEDWRERVRAARIKYDLAVAESSKVLEHHKQWPLPTPDGNTSIRHAGLAESAALNEYMRTLKMYAELVVSGKTPNE